MLQLLKDPQACEEFGRAGRQRYESLFTWQKVTGRIIDTLKSEVLV